MDVDQTIPNDKKDVEKKNLNDFKEYVSVTNDVTEYDLVPYQMTKNDSFVFFWTFESPFSQFYPSLFRGCPLFDYRGRKDILYTFECAEKWMMLHKALLFEDYNIADLILKQKTPSICKKLGRKVKNFDNKKWELYRVNIVYQGNWLKFSQNEDLKTMLLDQKGMFVEASPTDMIWGIGLSEENAKKQDPSTWKGLNLLGRILTKLRSDFTASYN